MKTRNNPNSKQFDERCAVPANPTVSSIKALDKSNKPRLLQELFSAVQTPNPSLLHIGSLPHSFPRIHHARLPRPSALLSPRSRITMHSPSSNAGQSAQRLSLPSSPSPPPKSKPAILTDSSHVPDLDSCYASFYNLSVLSVDSRWDSNGSRYEP